MTTRPYYGQIALLDPKAKEYPDWGTGQEEVVSIKTAIAVATRPDHLGTVTIEVWTGVPKLVGGHRLAFEGSLTVEGQEGVMVGSVTGNNLEQAPVPVGTHDVKVFVAPPTGDVDSIVFVFPKI